MKAVIAAAGTGGHINPGIAIAKKIMKEDSSSKILFIGTKKGLENDLVPRAGFDLKGIECYGIKRSFRLENIKRFFITLHSIKDSEKILKKFKPDIVIGTGGYICMSVCTAAKKLKIPYIIHESNALPGVSTKLLSKKADKILLGFKDAKKRLPKKAKTVITGNPTKIEKLNLSKSEKEKIIIEMNLKINMPIILVFGGSQGAKSINEAITDIIINRQNENYQIVLAAGKCQYENVLKKLEENNIDIGNIKNAVVFPFIYDMEKIINISDLLICRSGAMTITEIEKIGKPAIFIPFPFAAENHQEYNAKILEDIESARIIKDKDLNNETLNNMIQELIADKEKLSNMGKRANLISETNAEENIFNEIISTIMNNKNA